VDRMEPESFGSPFNAVTYMMEFSEKYSYPSKVFS
jgi:hypothetical protein